MAVGQGEHLSQQGEHSTEGGAVSPGGSIQPRGESRCRCSRQEVLATLRARHRGAGRSGGGRSGGQEENGAALPAAWRPNTSGFPLRESESPRRFSAEEMALADGSFPRITACRVERKLEGPWVAAGGRGGDLHAVLQAGGEGAMSPGKGQSLDAP